MKLDLVCALCFIAAGLLLPIAWNWPRLRSVVPSGRRMEALMFIAIAALAAALFIRHTIVR